MVKTIDLKHLPLYSKSINRTAEILALATSGVDITQGDIYCNMSKDQAIADYKEALWLLPRSKIFEVSPTLTKMLLNTDNSIYPTRLPFSPMFIECQLEYDMAWITKDMYVSKQKYQGLLLVEGNPMTAKDTPFAHLSHLVMEGKELIEKAYPNIYIYSVTEDEIGTGHLRISLYREYTDSGIGLEAQWKDERDYLRKFVMNFLDFLNDPDVETVKVLRSDKSLRKAIKHHKKDAIIKESNVIRLYGKLKHYVDALQTHVETHYHYGIRFWVRGHWKHLTAKRYHKHKCWCPPFIKGEGPLKLDKRYYAHQPLPKHHAGETMLKEKPRDAPESGDGVMLD